MKERIIKLLGSIKDILINPRRYFTKIVADGNLEEPIIRAFIYGLIGGILFLGIRYIGSGVLTAHSIFVSFIIIPVVSVTILFLLGGLLMLVSEITNGERDWEIAIKGLASVFFMYPIILLLNMMAYNCTSIWIISLLVDIYVLFLFYNIGLYCMKGKKQNMIIVICILVLFIVSIYATDYKIPWFILKNTSAALSCL